MKEINNFGPKRSADPLELFYDLIFVAALGNLSHILHEFNIENLIKSLLLFMIIYFTWYYVTYFSALQLKNTKTGKSNIWVVLVIIFSIVNVIMMLSGMGFENNETYVIFSIGLALNQLIPMIINIITVKIRNTDEDSRYIFYVPFLFSCTMLSLVPIYLKTILSVYLVLFLILIIQFVGAYFVNKKYPTSLQVRENISELLIERHLLFMILIFGEIIISILSTISVDNLVNDLIYALLCTGVALSIFLRIKQETKMEGLFKKVESDFFRFSITNYVLLVLLILLSRLPEIVSVHGYIPEPIKIIFLLISIYSFISHNNNVKRGIKGENRKFYQLDRILLYPYLIINIFMYIFIDSVFIYAFLLLISSLIHLLAIPFWKNID